ncbi:hypothetical protein ACFV1C_06980 [Streptomyces sp. NPDC059605]|uniref:hypothetical protein n=1 Tax=unclassified Streptomyces TaxID=2593676 RepID=UPI00369E3548
MSAADLLLLWHGRTDPRVVQEPLRTRSVVLLAACLCDLATGSGLEGPAVADIPLAQAVTVLDHHAASALESCRTVPAGQGGDVADELLGAYGTEEFGHALAVCRQALAHHLADGGPRVRITDRRPALHDAGSHPFNHDTEDR